MEEKRKTWKKPSLRQREPTTNFTQTWNQVWESDLGHRGRTSTLAPYAIPWLSEIEVKFSLLATTHFLVNQQKEFGVGSRLTSTWQVCLSSLHVCSKIYWSVCIILTILLYNSFMILPILEEVQRLSVVCAVNPVWPVQPAELKQFLLDPLGFEAP